MNEGTKQRAIELQQHAAHWYEEARRIVGYIAYMQEWNALTWHNVSVEPMRAEAGDYQQRASAYAAKARAILLDN